MKFLRPLLILVLTFISSLSWADAVYPVTNPTYIPTAISPPTAYSAPAEVIFTTSGLGTAVLQVSGTCTSLAASIQGTPQAGTSNITWSALTAYPLSGGAPVSSVTGTGVWRFDVSGLAQARLHITALTASCTIAMSGTAAVSPTLLANNSILSGGITASDPCQVPGIPKSVAAISQGASATTKVVDVSGTKSIYVCGFTLTAAGTDPTFTFKSGTHASADCDTGATSLSGGMTPSATKGSMSYGPGSTIFSTGASKQLCITTGATTDIEGILTYVQQ